MARSILLLLAIASVLLLAAPAERSDPPVSVFRALEGRWQGTFVGYDVTGKELYRLAVMQTYKTVDAETQSVVIEDRMPDGSVVRGSGANYARRGPDGELALSCDVRKSNGDRVQHTGRLTRGPLGEQEFIWSSAGADRSETFREAVVHAGDAVVYEIDGMGRYGDQLVLMAGRYRRASD